MSPEQFSRDVVVSPVDEADLEAEGNCFPAAIDLVARLHDRVVHGKLLRVCHGIATGQAGSPIAGRTYWHGWVEIGHRDDETTPVVVYDWSNGRRVSMLSPGYYQLGNITQVWRFTYREALEQITMREHYGPWVDEWKGMVDAVSE